MAKPSCREVLVNFRKTVARWSRGNERRFADDDDVVRQPGLGFDLRRPDGPRYETSLGVMRPQSFNRLHGSSELQGDAHAQIGMLELSEEATTATEPAPLLRNWAAPRPACTRRDAGPQDVVCMPVGNILWDCISLIDAAAITLSHGPGGLRAIAIRIRTFYATLVEWSRAIGDVPVYLHADDSKTGREGKKVEAHERHKPWRPGSEYTIDARRRLRARRVPSR